MLLGRSRRESRTSRPRTLLYRRLLLAAGDLVVDLVGGYTRVKSENAGERARLVVGQYLIEEKDVSRWRVYTMEKSSSVPLRKGSMGSARERVSSQSASAWNVQPDKCLLFEKDWYRKGPNLA